LERDFRWRREEREFVVEVVEVLWVEEAEDLRFWD
jgi:hypothetical protein